MRPEALSKEGFIDKLVAAEAAAVTAHAIITDCRFPLEAAFVLRAILPVEVARTLGHLPPVRPSTQRTIGPMTDQTAIQTTTIGTLEVQRLAQGDDRV